MEIKDAAQFLESCTSHSQPVILQGSDTKAFLGRKLDPNNSPAEILYGIGGNPSAGVYKLGKRTQF